MKIRFKTDNLVTNYISNEEYVNRNLITKSIIVPRTCLRKSVLAVTAGLRRFRGAV